ncbi:MAG: hypothetical protein V2A79_11505 [Planctomycetota bacterium]
MDLLKKNLFFIICGVVAIAGIALSAVGLKSMTDVRRRMGAADELLKRLKSAKPVNRTAIEDVNKRMAAIQSSCQEVIEWAHQRNHRDALVAGVFPKPSAEKKEAFRDSYVAKIDSLMNSLKAGEPPTAREVAEMREIIKNEQPRRTEAGAKGEKAEKPPDAFAVLTDEQARVSAAARVALVKAKNIYCYATLNFEDLAGASLQVIPKMYTGSLELPPETLWGAQRTLWVQQDVVEALARLNADAAGRLKEQGVEPWVGVLPVKELVSIRVSDYVLKDSQGKAPAPPGDPVPANPPGTADESFTGYYSADLYDVVQFTVKLVVDARQIPVLLDAICKDRFYTPLRVAYKVLPPNISMTDKIHGEDPVVSLVVDFEAYYFADIYGCLMPDAILAEIGRQRPDCEKKP